MVEILTFLVGNFDILMISIIRCSNLIDLNLLINFLILMVLPNSFHRKLVQLHLLKM